MGMYTQVAASRNGERELSIDRLVKIDGIARKTAEAVYEIGVHSYADLVHYLSQHTAQQISVALKEQGVNRPATFIDPALWAKQARAFGDLESAAPALVDEKKPPEAKPEEVPSQLAPEEPRDARIEIQDVQLSVVGPTAARPENGLKAEVRFLLSGSEAERLASEGIPFRIEGHTVDLVSGASELVTSQQSQLEPEVFEYVKQQEFCIPEVGRYEFYSIVLLLPPGHIAAYHRGPTMRIVP